jgi:nucleotide-binding universal stress UspA family protein
VESGEQEHSEPWTEGFELGTDGPATILVGADDSITSQRAGWYAMGLARRQGARLVAVYVAPIASFGTAGPGGAALAVAKDEAFTAIADDMRQRAERAAEEFGISVKFLVRRGEPFAEIARAADEVRADAIVVGASSKAGHRFVGSLAVRLVRAGRWPVTVVP